MLERRGCGWEGLSVSIWPVPWEDEAGAGDGAGTLEGLWVASWEEVEAGAGVGTLEGLVAVSWEEVEAGAGTPEGLEAASFAGSQTGALLSPIPVYRQSTWHADPQSGPEVSGGPCAGRAGLCQWWVECLKPEQNGCRWQGSDSGGGGSRPGC